MLVKLHLLYAGHVFSTVTEDVRASQHRGGRLLLAYISTSYSLWLCGSIGSGPVVSVEDRTGAPQNLTS